MAELTLYACNVFPTSNVCPSPANMIEFTIETDLTGGGGGSTDLELAEALEAHSIALNNNVDAMNDFFSLSAEDVGQISAIMLVAFIIGHAVGRVAQLLRKA